MIKPDERVLSALNTFDGVLLDWLRDSLAHMQKELETAPQHHFPVLQGKCQAVRNIIESSSGARDALERLRGNTSRPSTTDWAQ